MSRSIDFFINRILVGGLVFCERSWDGGEMVGGMR